MPFYGFKPNPKQLVVNKAKTLFGRDSKVNVTGNRPSALECKSLGVPAGVYVVECFVNDKSIAAAHTKSWRKAYSLLVIELEKVFDASLHNGSPV